MSDYISRDEIFSVWRSMPKPASISSLTDAINRTPAADVEPVRYVTPISCGIDEYYGEWVRCPNCDFDLNTSAAKFCGGCGAKMKLEDETNDD